VSRRLLPRTLPRAASALLVATAIATAGVLAGCGGDNNATTGSSIASQPTQTTVPTPPTTSTAKQGGNGSGGTPSPAAGNQGVDRPGNDLPPKPGPQSRFERFCKKNPGACD
jgi:hypothetical protein